MSECVFCSRRDQPASLFETESLYVRPDKYPLTAGQILIITKQHLRCYGEAPARALIELEECVETVRRFLRDAYQTEASTWENGVAGQTVFHAHLHLLPVPVTGIPAVLNGRDDVRIIEGWDEVQAHFEQYGHYRYIEHNGDRRLIAGHSPVLWGFQRLLEEWTGAKRVDGEWIKPTTPEDVAEVGRRWESWAG